MTDKTTKNYEQVSILDARILEKIKALLKDKGLKPVFLARALGYSDSWASQHMGKNRDRDLSLNQLLKIADILKVDPASLLPGSNPDNLTSFEEYLDFRIEEKTRKIFREELERYFKDKQ